MRQDSVLDYFHEILKEKGGSYGRQLIEEEMREVVVMTNYGRNATYIVKEVIWDKTPLSTFENSEGTEIRLQDYYAEKYQIRISEMEQPLLRSELRGKEVLLIPELCKMTGLSQRMKESNGLMMELAKKTNVSPGDRYR